MLASPWFRARWPKLRISLEDFYSEEAVPFYPLLVDVVSSTDRWVQDKDVRRAHVTGMKNMLLASPKMEVFDLILNKGDDVPVNWDIKEGEKLPPFKDLKLSNVDWVFSPVEAVGFWDWSKITHLTMTKVPIIPFLKTVTPEYLSGLRTFKTDCWGSENSVEEASVLLCDLVKNIATLEWLETKCSFKSHVNRCFPAVIKHGLTLRSLSLRNFHGPQDDLDSHSVLSIKKLTALRSACPNLTELEIDIKLKLKTLQRIGSILTTTIASFRNLRRLSLHSWIPHPTPTTRCREVLGLVEPTAGLWMEDLMSLKLGAQFDCVRLYLEMPGTTFPHEHHLDLGEGVQGEASLYVRCHSYYCKWGRLLIYDEM